MMCDKCTTVMDKPYCTITATADGLLWSSKVKELDLCKECAKKVTLYLGIEETRDD